MNGAETLLHTLVNAGVEVCFTNPGTSEMHFVAATDRVAGMRCVLGLFEGVVSGAADGYARMTGKPAATLLHLGPGLANALANFHNAMRARVPVVNIVGDHATYHRKYDAPLNSDVSAYAGPVSGWIGDVPSVDQIADLARQAVISALTPPRQIATLILPADCAWNDAPVANNVAISVPVPAAVGDDVIDTTAAIVRSGEPVAFLMSGPVLQEQGLLYASRIAAAYGVRVFCDTFNTRLQRGAGRAAIERLPYFPETVLQALAGFRHLIIVGTKQPVGFFAYPGVPSELTPPDCQVHTLASPEEDAMDALARLVDGLDCERAQPNLLPLAKPELPTARFCPESIGESIAALMPANTIVAEEAITAGLPLLPLTATAEPHDWLFITGGAIGQGLPVATGAAIACPDRKVLSLQADGSGMYTLQSLWTQARESLDVTTVIYANRAYRILAIEHQRVGAGEPGPKANDLFALDRPDIDWVKLAEGMGVPAKTATNIDEFNKALAAFVKEPGPNLIEAVYQGP